MPGIQGDVRPPAGCPKKHGIPARPAGRADA